MGKSSENLGPSNAGVGALQCKGRGPMVVSGGVTAWDMIGPGGSYVAMAIRWLSDGYPMAIRRQTRKPHF